MEHYEEPDEDETRVSIEVGEAEDIDGTYSQHTSRIHHQFIGLVTYYCSQACDGEWQDEWVRNAGEITIVETELRVVFHIPLPYFHHSGLAPEDVKDRLKQHLSPICRVQVEIAPPPDQRDDI